MKALFFRKPGAAYLLAALVAASAALVILESSTRLLQPARAVLNTIVDTGRLVAEGPYLLAGAAAGLFAKRTALVDKLDSLERRNLELSRIAQQFEALREENDRMRALLGSQKKTRTEVMITELVGVIPTVDTLQVVIDKGSNAGVHIGDAVIDAEGLFGQIVDTGLYTARVLLISDASHAVPVEVTRNGLRGIVSGTGQFDLLVLENLPVTADIRRGDELVSSGLGGRFPRGYPVGSIQSLHTEHSRGFVQASVKPTALLNASRHLLVLVDAADEPEPPE